MIKRIFDIAFSFLGLIVLTPLFLMVGIWVLVDDGLPIFFIQKRIGKDFKEFNLLKFRSMYKRLTVGMEITIGKDPRITPSGHYIRKYKLDELPQLLNVLKGEMSLVGPRPEVRKYVDLYNESQQRVLWVRPGITDEASIAFKNENEILAKSTNPEHTYIHEIMPAKIELNKRFIENPSIYNYLKIIFKTIF